MNESSKKTNSTKRNTAVIVAIILVCILAIGGTIAYLTSQSTLTNTFTVGSINPIDPTQPNPGPGGDPIPEEDQKPNAEKLDGNLYEPSWEKDSKLFPSATIKKDPYVGVGPKSEASVVYVYVENTMKNNDHVYFSINTGWEAVEGQVTEVAGKPGKYTGGLFKYTDGLDASKTEIGNVWTTTPLFSNVEVAEDAEAGDFVVGVGDSGKIGDIIVKAFLHQANDAKDAPIADLTILNAVKEAFGLK